MNKLLLLFYFFFIGSLVFSQEQSQHQLFLGNAAVDYANPGNNLYMQMQVGSPVAGFNLPGDGELKTSVSFPYGVLFISPTFIVNSFEVSKGYYSDKIKISWEFGANQEKIEKIKIHRRELGSTLPYEEIAAISKDIFEYSDREVEGGVLYEYKVEAVGVSVLNERYFNYMDGIGFRNPTATVSGSVSYDGGSPVQDVIVFAEANGVENNAGGSSLYVSDGYINVDDIEYAIPAKKLTLQTWLSSYGDVFKFTTTTGEKVLVSVGKTNDSKLKFNLQINDIDYQTTVLENSYPTGALDYKGNDVFDDISNLSDTSFVHVTVVLEANNAAKFYINGRELTQSYLDSINLGPDLTAPILTNTVITNYQDFPESTSIKRLFLVENYEGYIDETRIWQRTLSNEEIRRDYRRYLSGAESGMSLYFRYDENEGSYAYDLSKQGFRQNKNDGFYVLNISNGIEYSHVRPTKQQLGVFGVTDANGSFVISSIAYSGNGESFVITPSLGVHTFEPASQTLFLGSEESVVNQLNFKDVSSFKFNGKVVYNVQNVFNEIPLDPDEAAYVNIEDYGYNKYRVNGSTIINKGQFQYEGGAKNPSNGFYEGGVLKKYPVIGLEKASVYIDGNIVINSDNQPVETDADGNFTINVPIGKHKIEVRKDGHTFEHTGYFPASNTFDFFEDQIDQTWFIDTTRITLIGKVVGGKSEFEKPLGFGLDGTYSYLNFEGESAEEQELISTKNNIGVSNIVFKGDINTSNFDVSVSTHPDTGEYEVSLIPYIYYIKPSDLNVPSNSDISILSSNETLNLTGTPALDSITYVTRDNTTLYSKPFHHKKSFRYNAPVTLKLLEQEYEQTFTIGNNTYDISDLEHPIYTQHKDYTILFEVSQDYVNKDGGAGNEVVSKEFYSDGEFNITNNLEISGSSSIALINNGSQYKYTFTAGEANTTLTDEFKKSIYVQYSIPGSNPLSISNSDAFRPFGVIHGGASSDGVSFATVAPEVPDIILRDPPGSNSYASITQGTTLSYTEERTSSAQESDEKNFFVSVGPTWTTEAGTPFFGVETEVNVVSEVEKGISKSVEFVARNTTSNTYTFNQTISTSDDPSYVGSDGDLYIGNSTNVFYGLYNNIVVSEAPLQLPDGTPISYIEILAKNEAGDPITLYVSSREEVFIAEQPTDTFFAYSQKYIVDTLIPELENLAANFVPDPDPDPDAPEITADYYTDQANLWRRIIQENERTKYQAKNNTEEYRSNIIETVVSGNESIIAFVNDNFFSNKSFDAGVGELSNSVETSIFAETSVETSVVFSSNFIETIGALVNDVGATASINISKEKADTNALNFMSESTSTISYTLKDNDDSNVLSVDVVNMFDGNGPVFVTRAGATSCPHEPEATSMFYNSQAYDADVVGSGGEALSIATNKVYFGEISAEKTVASNIPESEAASFTLLLKNKSETQTDLSYIIEVDALSLNGATTNIATGGLTVYLPFNETVSLPFEISKSSASDVYDYPAIKVYLKNSCNSSPLDTVEFAVDFKKSCSRVALSAPEANWIFNRSEAFSVDANGNTTTNALPITISDFNIDFSGFKKIELQYRNESSANWIKLQTYYGSQALMDEAADDSGIVISASEAEYTFNWDIVGDQIPDGNYEFRAITFCTDDITNSSSIISGTVNLNPPVLFGTPNPSDGILDVGEDISLRFNEAVFEGGTTQVKVTGLSNQQDIDHSVSVYLDGSTNQIELPNQNLPNGSFTLQFWFKNATTGSGTFISQQNGINATLDGNELTFSVGDHAVTAVINPNQYNFYSLVYQDDSTPLLLIFENGLELSNTILNAPLDLNTNASIYVGGSNTMGNIHDIRFWSRAFTPAQATVAKDKTLGGNELNLLGYWLLDEGYGTIGLDKAKRKNAVVNLDWDIKPKGTAYSFNNSYLTLNNVGFVQPTEMEDITVSFWVKTPTVQTGTLLSNGRGTTDDLMQSNGFRNKWSINMTSDGNLELMTEDIGYNLTTQSIADGNWHHIAFVVKRRGTINAYIDGMETTSVSSLNIGGISGNKFLVGARLVEDVSNIEIIDNYFTGYLDEIRLWNTARSLEQIKRDRFFEIDPESEGLLLYMDFNQEEGNTSNGPKYNHLAINNTTGTTYSLLSTANQEYTQDAPTLKPKHKFTNIPFSTIVNGDQMIIQPELTTEEWSLFENQILNFSVSRMIDTHFNEQLSPVSWSAFVNKQEIEWFTADQTKVINDQKNVNEAYSFTMDVVNKGGSNQAYTISGLPTWISTQSLTGSVAPNSVKKVTFVVDTALAMGNYSANLFLETSSGFNDRLTFDLRVLTSAPDWSVNAQDYSYSMNAIAKIKINDIFSRDAYTKVGAFVNHMPRGEAYLQYDPSYDSYFAYLTIYSNDVNSAETLTFKIWDAINGKVLTASIDDQSNTLFIQNQILGSKKTPVIFSGDLFTEQSIPLNSGWTWVSYHVSDSRFDNIKATFEGLTLENDDQIKSQNQFTRYENGDWFGSLTLLEHTKMYKIKLAQANTLKVVGNDIDESQVNIALNQGWSWLAYPIHRSISLEDALAFYNPTDGDVIKDQYSFAIYDEATGWSGNLNYMQPHKGYMINSGVAQTFNYPNSENTAYNIASNAKPQSEDQIEQLAYSSEIKSQLSQYASSMGVVFEIIGNEHFTKLEAFDQDNVLRGVSSIDTLNNREMSFLTVHSDISDWVKIKLSNTRTSLDANVDLLFEANNVIGSVNAPVIINLDALSSDASYLSALQIYPNPFSDSVTIMSPGNSDSLYNVALYSIQGTLIMEKKACTNQTQLSTKHLASGIYLMKLSTPKGHNSFKKLVKK